MSHVRAQLGKKHMLRAGQYRDWKGQSGMFPALSVPARPIYDSQAPSHHPFCLAVDPALVVSQ